MLTANKRLLRLLLLVPLVLLVPFIAMQFTSEVNWSAADFLIAAVLLGGTILACEAVIRLVRKRSVQLLLCAIVLLLLCLTWLELAVGIFGTPFAGS
ncbi:MAG TPA: hypothetical protein VL307_11555 [Chitinophagaceae bacterium]|nr:hypothetical protein [Chitinophagaceae bacterium]